MAVYFVRRKDDAAGLIKIGSSGNIVARLRSLSTATPGGVELLASCAGGAAVEHRFHRELAASRVDGGEWFRPTPEVMAHLAKAKAESEQTDERGPTQPKSRPVNPEDEFSQDIAVESRFYLNELVKREWRGVGDTVEEARIRVAKRFGLAAEKCRRIWYAMSVRVDGDSYRVLNNEYARVMKAEGRATAHHLKILSIERFFQKKRAKESNPSPVGAGMARAPTSAEREMR